MPRVVKFVTFEPFLMLMTVFPGAGSISKGVSYISQPKGPKYNAATIGRHTYTKAGHINAVTRTRILHWKAGKQTHENENVFMVGRLIIRFFAAPTVIPVKRRNYKSTWCTKAVGEVVDMGKLNKSRQIETTSGGNKISVLADSCASVSIIWANQLDKLGDGVKCARKRLKEPIKLMRFSRNLQQIN